MTNESHEGLISDQSHMPEAQTDGPPPQQNQPERTEPTPHQPTFGPLNFFNQLAKRKEALARLNVLAEAHSLRAYGQLDSNEHGETLRQWSNQMSEWAKEMNQIDPKLFSQIHAVARHISTPPNIDNHQAPNQNIDWIAFYNNLHRTPNLGSVEAFVARLKTMPGIRENAKGMEALSRMFGTEVHDKLFGIETQEEAHGNRTKKSEEAVEKAFGAGKIDEEKKDRLLNKIYERIEIDSKFTIEEKNQIQEMLHNIPPDLLRNIAKVYKLEEDHIGAAVHDIQIISAASKIGIKSSTLNYSKENANSALDNNSTEGVLYHEILGHALRHYIVQADEGLAQKMLDLLKGVPNDLLIKDTYAKRYIGDGDPEFQHFNVPRSGIPAAVDEFWADRMSEYWGKKNGKTINMHRDQYLLFTDAEELYIDHVCQQIFDIYISAVAHKRRKNSTTK